MHRIFITVSTIALSHIKIKKHTFIVTSFIFDRIITATKNDMSKLAKDQKIKFPKDFEDKQYIDSVKDSQMIQDYFKFKLFSIIHSNGRAFRVIGYKKNESGLYYLLIENYRHTRKRFVIGEKYREEQFLASNVPLKKLSRSHVELGSRFTQSNKMFTESGILSEPKEGDGLMCVGRERYVGVSFEEQYTAHDVYEEKDLMRHNVKRIRVEKNAAFSYEAQYFIVISRTSTLTKEQANRNASDIVWPDSKNLCNEIENTNTDQAIERRRVDEDNVRMKEVEEVPGLIRRIAIKSGDEGKRAFFKTELIRRKV